MKIRSLLLVALLYFAGAGPALAANDAQGVWLVDGKAAVELFDCNTQLCGRIRWLQEPVDSQGNPKVDKTNPDVAQRQRPLCGLNVIGGLRPGQPGHWDGGWFYDPDGGKNYKVKLELASSDRLVARFYKGVTALGVTKTLTRVAPGKSAGWC